MLACLRALLLFAALLAAAASARADPVGVALREQARVSGPTYTLGEIADLSGGTGAARKRLARLVIGQAPRYGYSQIVTREMLAAQLRRLGVRGLTAADRWGGANQVLVRSRGIALDAAALADTAARALFAAWAPRLSALEARPIDPIPAPAVRPGRVSLDARLPEGAALGRRMMVAVDVAVDSAHVATVPIWFTVHAMRPVRVARVALAAGDLPREDAFERVVRDVTAYPSPPVPVSVPLTDERLRAGLPANGVLTAAHVEPRPAVARDEPVQVLVDAGRVRLQTTGIALADARIGEQVRVMNPASHDAYTAQVVATGRVVAIAR